MGKFKQLAIDIDQRAEKPSEWALILDDDKRPAELWKILGEFGPLYFLENAKRPDIKIFRPAADCWIIA